MSKNQPISALCPVCKYHMLDDIFSVDTNVTEIECVRCNTKFKSDKGSVKLLRFDSPEEEYYDEIYSRTKIYKKGVDYNELRELWFSSLRLIGLKFLYYKSNTLEHNFNDFNGKTILLLGNGVSEKELYLLALGARLIYTDVSHRAILFVKEKFDFENKTTHISFHSLDAENIAIESESVDYVMGYEFVHHLDDLNHFFKEVNRVLKKNGLCLFFDGAYSGFWQKLKFSILKPIVNFSHKRSGISPQDLKATHKGGYKKSEILEIKEKFLFCDYIYCRSGFFSSLTRRFVIKIMGQHDKAMLLLSFIIPKIYKIDTILSKNINFFHNNTIDLFWGFKK